MRALAFLLAAPAMISASAPASAGSTSTITVTVTDLRASDGSYEGIVRACLTSRENAFPKCSRDPNSKSVSVRAGASVTLRFENVAPGDYAIAILHDENEDGKANRVLGMAPREGYGFSRDAPVRMAPPSWDDAVFEMGAAPKRMTIRMRYFL